MLPMQHIGQNLWLLTLMRPQLSLNESVKPAMNFKTLKHVIFIDLNSFTFKSLFCLDEMQKRSGVILRRSEHLH